MPVTRAPKTIVVYDLNGQADFTIPFDYLARKFIAITLIGVDRKLLELNIDYRFTAKTQITLSVPNPEGYNTIEIRRFTSATERLVSFHDGSILRSYDLNLSQIQTLHVAEEARDLAGDSIGINDEGDLDARGRKIVNLGNATEDTDAVNYGQLKTFDDSTYHNALKAEDYANNARASQISALDSKFRSVEAEVKSVSSAGTAMQAAMDSRLSMERTVEAEEIVVPLVPIVEQASQDAANAAAQAEQAVTDVKDLGAVPVGTIMMFGHKAIPAGYIDLCVANPTFSLAEFPELAKLYPTGVLPSYLNRYPKGYPINTVSTKGAWMIPEHTHNTDISHAHSASSTFTGVALPPHSHTYSRMRIANVNDHSAAQGTWLQANVDYTTSSVSAGTPTGTVATSVSTHNETKVSTGIREAISKGSSLDVDHTGTTFAIKAAGAVANEGLMEVVQIKEDVIANTAAINTLEAEYKTADANLQESIDGLGERIYIVDTGRHTDVSVSWWWRKWSNGFIEQGGRFNFSTVPKDQYGASLYQYPVLFADYKTVGSSSEQENSTSTYYFRSGTYDKGIRGKFAHFGSGEPAPSNYSEFISWTASGF